jgi:hypothetical protein
MVTSNQNNFSLYIGKDSKKDCINKILDGTINIESKDIYIVNLDTTYDEPYIENLANIEISSIPFIIKEEKIFFVMDND